MQKHLLTATLAIAFCANTMADGSQTVTINGTTTDKMVSKITFSNENVILHYADGTEETATDMELVVVTFSTANGIAKASAELDDNATWYDLSGRKLPGVPTQSGTYIKRTTGKTMKIQK